MGSLTDFPFYIIDYGQVAQEVLFNSYSLIAEPICRELTANKFCLVKIHVKAEKFKNLLATPPINLSVWLGPKVFHAFYNSDKT